MNIELSILGFLMSEPKSGYMLKSISDNMMMFYNITLNQIYPTLRKLESAGYIKKEIVFQTNKPNKNLYSLTPEGKEYFYEKMTGPSAPMNLHFPFFIKAFFFRFLKKEQIVNEFEKDIKSIEALMDNLSKASPNVEDKADEFGEFIFKTTVLLLETLQKSYSEELDNYKGKK